MSLGTASFFALSYLDDKQFMSWGWRIPFVASAALVAIGTFIRLRIDETPDFKRVVREGKVSRMPVLEAVRRHPKEILIGLGARITEISWIYVLTIFGLSYAVTTLALPRSLVLGAIALGAAVELITIPLFGSLSDSVGRRPIYLLGCVVAMLLSFPIFWALGTRDPVAVVLAFVVGMSVGHAIMYGVQASFLSEMFPSNLRYSGASLGYQIAAPIGGGACSISRRRARRIDSRRYLAGLALDDFDRGDHRACRAGRARDGTETHKPAADARACRRGKTLWRIEPDIRYSSSKARRAFLSPD